MSCTNNNIYSEMEFQISLLGRAVSHPARVKIIMKLQTEQTGFRNIDFVNYLGLAKSTVKTHIDILKDAELVDVKYGIHHYLIFLNEKGRNLAEALF